MKINRTFIKKVALSRLLPALSFALAAFAFGSAFARELADGFPLLYSRDGSNLERIWRELEEGGSSAPPFADAVDFQLRRQGARYRGKLLAVSGRLLRAAREVAPTGGVYYELWVLLPDSTRDPIRILARRAPHGFQCDARTSNATPYPRDVEYRHETVTTRAIYYRSTSYDAGDDFYTAPTLVALDFAVSGGAASSPQSSDSGSASIWREILKLRAGRVIGLVLIWLAIRNFIRRRRANRLAKRGLTTSGCAERRQDVDSLPKLLLFCAVVGSSVVPVVAADDEAFWSSLSGATAEEWREETGADSIRSSLDTLEPGASRRALASRALARFSRALTPSALVARAPSLRGESLREFVARGGAPWSPDAEAQYFVGRVVAITTIELSAAERELSGLERIYRLALSLESGGALAVYSGTSPTFRAPSAFFDGGARASGSDGLGERVAGVGVRFGAERWESGDATPSALTPRLGWFPSDAPLGRAGVDLLSFDAVKVYAPNALDREREPDAKRLIARALRWTTEERAAFYESLAASATARELGGVSTDVVSLFNRPERVQGARVDLRGWARRVNLVVVTDPDARASTGLERYYQVYLFTNESQGRPITLCVAELPDGLTPGGGREYRREVEFSGFFYKTWAYRESGAESSESAPGDSGARAKGAWTSSPVVIGRITRAYPASEPSRSPVAPSAVFVIFGALACAWIALRRLATRKRVPLRRAR